MNKLPKIRENLLVQDLKDEVLIFDPGTNKSYCLNSTAKIVFNHCDGVKTFADLRISDEMIYFTLDELRKQNLIESDYASPFAGMNRREAVRRVGLASMVALPLISSLTAPRAAQAASQTFAPGSRVVNESCNTSTDCEQALARNCVSVRGQSSTGRACCLDGTSSPTFITGGDPNGGVATPYASQAACESAASRQCCSRQINCQCTSNGNGTVTCRTTCL